MIRLQLSWLFERRSRLITAEISALFRNQNRPFYDGGEGVSNITMWYLCITALVTFEEMRQAKRVIARTICRYFEWYPTIAQSKNVAEFTFRRVKVITFEWQPRLFQ